MSMMIELGDNPQAKASDPAGSAWVSANAGSGKTHVLVNRVVRLMLDGTLPERILCLTYTRAAAAEMSKRLFDELADWIALDDDALLKRIHEHTGHVTYEHGQLGAARQLFARALETPGGLKVQTIHAFCERLLQRFPVEAGMVPGFEVMDDQTAREVLGEARAMVLAKARTDPAGDTAQQLATIVGFTSADRFDELLKGLLSHRHELKSLFASSASLEAGLEQLCNLLDVDATADPEAIIEDVIAELDIEAYRLALSDKHTAKIARTGIERLLNAEGGREKFARLQDLYLTGAGELRKEVGLFNKAASEGAPALKEFLLSEQRRVAGVLEWLRASQVYAATSSLMQVGRQIVDAYENEKRRQGLCDYDDLISRTRDLLEEKEASLWVLYKLDGGLDHVLIDEAQDTSPQQWSIIARLTEEFFAGEGVEPNTSRTVFAVGDYKQSIYSFQGADPAEFARMQKLFKIQISGVGEKLTEVPLLASFRSTPEVLKVVDDVFALPGAGIGLEDLNEATQAHTAKRLGHAGLVELWPLVVREDKSSASIWTAPKRIDAGNHPRLRLARKIAKTIKKWIDDGEELTPRGRAIRYSDILLLVRQRTTFMDALVRELKFNGIPVAGADRLVLTQHIAVQDLMALARFVLLPEDDLTLASVLKSPLVARDDGRPIEDDDLFELAYDRGKQTLWERLHNAAGVGAPVKQALTALQGWRNQAGYATPYAFFSQILIADGGRKALLRRLGTEASDPIDAFLAEALNYETGNVPSLHEFLGWLEGANLQIKRDMDHSANEVRIMTVHGAKGLEANVVILPDTTDVPDASKVPDVLFWRGDTSGPLPIWKLRSQDKIPITSALKEQHSTRAMEEYNRLLYVAMTRARDRLYVCGHNNKDEARPNSWYRLIKDVMDQPENKTADGNWRIEGQQVAKTEDRHEEIGLAEQAADLEAWAQTPPAPEAANMRWFVPSKLRPDAGDESTELAERVDPPLGGPDKDRYRRGNLIHKLLQILPDVATGERHAMGQQYLERSGVDNPESILSEVLRLVDDPVFAPVFAPGSLAEVPLAAQLDLGAGTIGLTGQIDRLVVTDDTVLIVDYKTNRPAPKRIEAADKAYIRQLAAYRAALGGIYPGRTIRAALLWTNTASLMEVPGHMLDSALSIKATVHMTV